ncbi:MAG: hypothetical protein ACQEXC_07560, partial [Pseudomonadota bacterium]
MSSHDETLLVVTSPITVDETAGTQGDDDDIAVTPPPALITGLYTTYGTPDNLAYKAGMITLSAEATQDLTNIGWAQDINGSAFPEAGDTGVTSNLLALDPVGGYEAVTLNVDQNDDNVLIGTTASGSIAFIAVIVPGTTAGSYDVYLLDYLPKQHNLGGENHDDTATLDGLYVNVTVDDSFIVDFEDAPSGQNVFMAFGELDGVGVVVTGTEEGQTVNSSKSNNEPTSLAANSNNINAGEGLVVTYVNNMVDDYIVPNLSGPEASDPANIQFDSLKSATEASVTIVKVGPGSTATVHLTARNTDIELGDGSPDSESFIQGLGDDDIVRIDKVFITSAGGSKTPLGMDSNEPQYYSLQPDGSVVVYGVTNNDTITFETGELYHNRFEVENAGTGNARFNIGGIGIGDVNELNDADAVTLNFDDDGPTVDVTLTEAAAPSLTTQDAE